METIKRTYRTPKIKVCKMGILVPLLAGSDKIPTGDGGIGGNGINGPGWLAPSHRPILDDDDEEEEW